MLKNMSNNINNIPSWEQNIVAGAIVTTISMIIFYFRIKKLHKEEGFEHIASNNYHTKYRVLPLSMVVLAVITVLVLAILLFYGWRDKNMLQKIIGVCSLIVISLIWASSLIRYSLVTTENMKAWYLIVGKSKKPRKCYKYPPWRLTLFGRIIVFKKKKHKKDVYIVIKSYSQPINMTMKMS